MNKHKKKKLESESRENVGGGCCASRVVKGMVVLIPQGVNGISGEEVVR